MSEQAKLAVIGDQDSIMVFQALGVRTVYANAAKDIEKAIHALAK